ncbi:MAG TPA: hypothetical protein PKC30_04990 [Saprospiraceae bacterium]|nr:hypothetical protein [Saprospiraceae bacterium]
MQLLQILIFCTITLIFQIRVWSQTSGYESTQGMRAAYMGSIIYSGFTLGIEIPKSTKPFLKAGSYGTKTHYKEQFNTLNFGLYHHPTFHTLLYAQYELIFRRQYSGGFFYDAGPGFGVSRTFVAGPVYEVNDQGHIDQKSLPGHFYVLMSGSGSLGYNFGKNSNLPLKMFLKSSIFLMGPYNKFVYFRPTIEAGAIFIIKGAGSIAL